MRDIVCSLVFGLEVGSTLSIQNRTIVSSKHKMFIYEGGINMKVQSINELRDSQGLRIVLVAGAPSPWGQAAKAMMEYKGLDYSAGLMMAGAANEDVVNWAGVNSGPVVAWNNERPIDRWTDILFLIERLEPKPALIPENAKDRADLFGLSHELNGELGMGWNRRLLMFAPVIESGDAPEPIANMSAKYKYNRSDCDRATDRIIAMLGLLHERLDTQKARGSGYFIGNTPTALDFYWTAFSILIDLMPFDKIPLAQELQPLFTQNDPAIKSAFTPALREHRDRFFSQYFRSPMEF